MQTIYVPTFAAFRGDVETMLSVLEQEVSSKHPDIGLGLEIGGKPEHFTQQENLEKIAENMNEVAKGVKTIVHGFSGLEVYTQGIADMSKEVGRQLLSTYIELAKQLGSHYVHVHGAVGYPGVKTPKDKAEKLGKVRKNLLYEKSQAGNIKIGIENLPTPSACDFDVNPETVWSDYVEQIEDCLEVVKGSDLKATFDTAHHGINKDGYVHLINPMRRLGGHLHHLHVGDCSGYWSPHISKAYDGVIPGEGRIGKDSFAKFFKYIRENHPDIGICLEIHNKDFQDPAETRESIKRVIKWLAS